ncbi:hypothetical protein DL93DRAFT_1044105 [Clavulina sp. PMI_390]|nr:hypothetical protein DL93DRAFT_1044105 [Clavulina sp. PMI_390]
MESAVSEQPGAGHATIDHCLCGAALPTRTPVDLVSFADEDAPSVYCSTACARQDALDSLMAKDPRHSPSSSRVSKPTSSLPSSMTASTTSTMSDSTSASSFIYFSESSPSSASSLAMPDTPSHLYRSSDEFFQSRHAELVDVEEDGFLFQIVHSPTSPSNAASQPHMYADVAVDPNFKSHYQRVVASQDASLFTIPPLPSVGSPSVNASVAPSVPAVPVAPGAAQAPHSPPGLKRVRAHSNLLKTRAPRSLTPSTASFSDEEEEDRSRTPQSWDQVRPHAGALESPVGPHATASEEAQADLPATQSPPVRTMSEVWREIQQSESPSPFQQSAATLQDLNSPTDAPSEIEPTPPISDDYTNGESMARRSMDEIPSVSTEMSAASHCLHNYC